MGHWTADGFSMKGGNGRIVFFMWVEGSWGSSWDRNRGGKMRYRLKSERSAIRVGSEIISHQIHFTGPALARIN